MKTIKWIPTLGLVLLLALLALSCCKKKEKMTGYIYDSLIIAQNPMGLTFDTAEIRLMKPGLESLLGMYKMLRQSSLPNQVPPALVFNPLPIGFVPDTTQKPFIIDIPRGFETPVNKAQLAFCSIPQLAYLLRTGKVTSTQLTLLYLERLKHYDKDLHCVISYTEDYALAQAKKADEEIAAGKCRSLLHGIPFGAKDLFSFSGYKTTWGSVPYKDQVIDETATVLKKLEDAGAVLIAKFSLGELAMGDIWFEDTTRNPWDLKQGSSGSSAGSAAATAAGLVPFAIGTETLGSIVSPSTRCGTTGLRPTFGRVSRTGAMALSWSMDKVGPICRSAEDCAIVFNVIRGGNGKDKSVIDASFNYAPIKNLSDLRIGYYKSAFDEDHKNRKNDRRVLEEFQKLGATLIPVEFPSDLPVQSLELILSAEAAAAFDELTRSNRDSLMVSQERYAWPNQFREARFIPAVEYIQANRFRTLLCEEMFSLMKIVDVIITPSYGGDQLLITNLTGNPCVVMPDGFTRDGHPTSISIIGRLYDEATLLAVAKVFQDHTMFHTRHPSLFLEKY